MESDACHISDSTLDGLAQFKLLTHITGCQTGMQATLFARHQTL